MSAIIWQPGTQPPGVPQSDRHQETPPPAPVRLETARGRSPAPLPQWMVSISIVQHSRLVVNQSRQLAGGRRVLVGEGVVEQIVVDVVVECLPEQVVLDRVCVQPSIPVQIGDPLGEQRQLTRNGVGRR